MRLAHRQTGTPDGLPVVFLHGLGDDGTTWRRVVERMPERWTIALDQRGHGHSDWTDGYELTDMVADVAGFLDALRVPHVDLVGHSMGAQVAYLFAEQHPRRVRRLVLEEPPPPEPASPPRDEGERPDGDLGYDWCFQAPFSRQRNHPDPAWWENLTAITADTLVLTGVDSHLPADATRRMVERIPRCRSLTFAAGHLIHEGLLDEFSEALVAFLDEPVHGEPALTPPA